MSTKVAVVMPVYRELDELEKISLAQCRKILGHYPLIFAAPVGKNFSFVEAGDMIARFPAEYFQSTKTYSRLMLSPQFYATFADFDYILIYQTDAFVFYDALKEFCALGYDYIGTPWSRMVYRRYRGKQSPRVGNGGFSLRKVKACRDLLTPIFASPDGKSFLASYSEDMFFSLCGMLDEFNFNVAPVEVAKLFSREWHLARHVKRFGLPFGCHYWNKFSADFYVKTFRRFGYDLQPFRDMMGNDDYEKRLEISLTNVAVTRLLRRIEHGQSILRYLPTKRFASVQVIRSADAIKILSRLLTEENFLTDKIFIRDDNTCGALFSDMTVETLPHLIISADYDATLIEALEAGGLRYGEHVISFQREYMRHCEKIFHSLGR